MKVPTLQELQRGLQLTYQQKLALFVAAEFSAVHVSRRKVWQSLVDLRLIDADHQLTTLGKMELNNLKKKSKLKRK